MTAPDRARRWALVVLAVYTVFLAAASAVPRPIDTGLTPWVRGLLASMRRVGFLDWLSYEFVESAAHVALFVPFGILAVVAFGRRLAGLAALLGLAMSALTEFASSRLSGEVPLASDLALNTIGAVAGSVIGVALLAGLGSPRPQR
jgi:VanZ family protein